MTPPSTARSGPRNPREDLYAQRAYFDAAPYDPSKEDTHFVAVAAGEASNASEEAHTNAFTERSDSERQPVMEALHTASMSKATTSGTVCPASCGVSGTVGMAKSSFRMWC